MEIITAPNPKLRIKTKPVKKITPELLKVASEMIKLAQSFSDPEGVGMASTQIGREEKFFVGKLADKFTIFINPEVLTASKKTKVYFEGCLSVPNYWGEVERPVSVKICYQDETGQKIITSLKGIKAWIVQHEIDHLNGKLFIDRVLEQKRKVFKVVGKDKTGADIFEEVRI